MKTTTRLVLAALVLGGCGATTPVPADKLARTQESVRIAEAMPTTATDPKALEHLQLAQNQLNHAKKLMIDGDNEDAKCLLMRAEADAEAARALAHAQAAKMDAVQTIEAIRQAMAVMQEQEGTGQ